MTTPAIELAGLTKVYRTGLGGGQVTALSGVDLKVERGEVFGLLGPNGAGKTTAVKVLLGLTFPTAGTTRLLGIPSALAYGPTGSPPKIAPDEALYFLVEARKLG